MREVSATARMEFGSKFVYTPENDSDEVEEVEEEEDETIEDVRRRHQASRDDGQVRKSLGSINKGKSCY